MEESQVTTVKQNRDGMNNLSQENTFLLFKHQNFLLKHTQNITYLFATANISTGSVQFLILLVRRWKLSFNRRCNSSKDETDIWK